MVWVARIRSSVSSAFNDIVINKPAIISPLRIIFAPHLFCRHVPDRPIRVIAVPAVSVAEGCHRPHKMLHKTHLVPTTAYAVSVFDLARLIMSGLSLFTFCTTCQPN